VQRICSHTTWVSSKVVRRQQAVGFCHVNYVSMTIDDSNLVIVLSRVTG